MERDYAEIPPVPCYPQQLGQVFMNLLVNAAEAIDEQGKITISTRAEGDGVVVRIKDTGCGIPPANLKRIFEPFFTTKPVGQGTGLGLHVACKIVEVHGGDIRVESVLGAGTEFALRLPLKEPPEMLK